MDGLHISEAQDNWEPAWELQHDNELQLSFLAPLFQDSSWNHWHDKRETNFLPIVALMIRLASTATKDN